MERIVVGIDGSAHAENALHWALHEAERTGASIEAVAVHASPMRMYAVPMEAVVYSGVSMEELEKATSELLERTVQRVVGRSTVEVTRVVAEGTPAQVLRQAAKGADLLVVGTHGYGAIRGSIVGSVTLKLLHDLPCPLVAVPLPE